MKQTFEDRSLEIGRKNCAKFARMHEQVPPFGLGYRFKKWCEKVAYKYNNNRPFADLVDFSLLILFACVAFAAIYTITLHVIDPNP